MSLLILIEQSHGTTFVMTVGDKKGDGHVERAEKGLIPCNKSIQAKDEKERGRVPKMYDRGWDTTSYLFYGKLWQRRHYIKVKIKIRNEVL